MAVQQQMNSASSRTWTHIMHRNPVVKERLRKGLLYMSTLTSSGNKDISSGMIVCHGHCKTADSSRIRIHNIDKSQRSRRCSKYRCCAPKWSKVLPKSFTDTGNNKDGKEEHANNDNEVEVTHRYKITIKKVNEVIGFRLYTLRTNVCWYLVMSK
jgi:hypothetical protein